MIQFQKQVFSNGLRVYLAPMHETQAVTVLFLVNIGSRYETEKQNGLSHFLEHMFFKGTHKRPTTLDISEELDTLGADYNAYTSEEFTGYYVSTAAEHFPIAFDVLTDMLYNSTLEQAEIEKEKGVICEEIKMYSDNPQSYLNEIAKRLTYGETPLGRDVAGTPKTVKAFSRSDFVSYQEQNYGPENTLLVVAGNPGSNDWLSLIEGTLSKLEPKKALTYPKQTVKPKTKVKIGHKPVDQASLELIHYSFPHTDLRNPTVHVLSNILGGSMSSRLFVEVREKRGLAYYAYSRMEPFHDIGTLNCSAGVDPKKLPEAVTVMLQEVNRFKTEPVSDIELVRAKQNIRGRMSLQLEDSHSIARYIATEELEQGEVIQPEAYIEKIEKVTKDDIMRVANEIFDPKNRKLAVVGPFTKTQEKEFEKLLG